MYIITHLIRWNKTATLAFWLKFKYVGALFIKQFVFEKNHAVQLQINEIYRGDPIFEEP